MQDEPKNLERVERAREMFFIEGRDPGSGVAPHITRSWRRCRPVLSTADVPSPLTAPHLLERREQAMRLLESAQPELETLAEHVLGEGCVVILTDDAGLILDEIGSADFMPKARRVALAPGVDWSEGLRGTNAIGTALVERQALLVLGGEHLLPQHANLGCAAAPIFTGRGAVAGSLDISGEPLRVNGHALGLVRMAAMQVEHRMLVAGARGHLLRFHRQAGLIGTPREGLLVVEEGRIVGANRVALSLLGERWDEVLDEPVERLLGQRWSRLQATKGPLTLPDGQEIALSVEAPTAASGAPRPALVAVMPAGAPDADDALEPLLERAARVLDEGLPVLINGETGSGKDVFARRLHAGSRRRAGPLVAVNCAALPEALIEAELFGYEDGAFTGARRRGSPGRIREAAGGVLFLDEIGDMPLSLQTRLLRVLEERVVTPLGGGAAVPVDFDLVCATHRDLAAQVAAGAFRQDLLYRVDGYRVALPPLRQRLDRRTLILRLFDELGRAKGLQLAAAALDRLAAHDWPGNVRELRSVLRAAVALAEPGSVVLPEDLPGGLGEARPAERSVTAEDASPAEAGTDTELSEITRQAIDRTLADCKGRVAEAARRLGVHRSTLYRHLAQQRPH